MAYWGRPPRLRVQSRDRWWPFRFSAVLDRERERGCRVVNRDPNRDFNNRTHEPSLRELTAELDGLREWIEARLDGIRELLNERDRLYRERDDSRRTAVDAALTAVKEQTKASFEASEKAIVKAEEAQRAYNLSHNDLSKKLDEQNKATMPRTEAESRFHTLQEKIDEVRNTVAEVRNALASGGGVIVGGKAMKDESRSNIALVVAVGSLLLAIAVAALALLNRP